MGEKKVYVNENEIGIRSELELKRLGQPMQKSEF